VCVVKSTGRIVEDERCSGIPRLLGSRPCAMQVTAPCVACAC
jgi:hypothetical protein